jgi:small subunit ribosomal protein S20
MRNAAQPVDKNESNPHSGAPSRTLPSNPVANTAQAKKRARQAEKHRAHNSARRSLMRTEIKNALKAIESKDEANAQTAYRRAASVIDRLAAKGMLHRNTASRYKSRLNNRLRALASA